MTSLVDSIFGVDSAVTPATVSLFESKIDVPEPREYPAPTKKRKASDHHNEADRINEKQRKPRKSEDGKAVDAGGGADDDGDVMIGPKEKRASSAGCEGGNDTEDNVDDRTIFVGNLPLHYTRRALQRLFSDCGKIESTRIRSVAAAGVKLPPSQAGNQNLVKKVCSNTQQLDASAKLSVLGYVVFTDQVSVESALQKNNLAVPESDDVIKPTTTSTAKGTTAVRHIRVDRVSQPLKDPTRTVFVGNLPYTADEESLAQHVRGKLGHIARHHQQQHSVGKTTAPTAAGMADLIEGVRIVRDKDTQLCKGFGYILFRDTTTAAAALRTCHETKYMQRVLRVQVCGKRYKNQQGVTTQPKAEGRRKAELADSVGALKRVLTKQLTVAPRKRAERKKGGGAVAKKAGVSKRAASEAKTGKRIKKIEKRLTKGMGKARKW